MSLLYTILQYNMNPSTEDFLFIYCVECSLSRHYTVRYREKSRKWNYQTCPTKDTVIDNLKPNTVYEFGVQPSSKDGTGVWSKPVIHNVSTTAIDGRFDIILTWIQKQVTRLPRFQVVGDSIRF